MQSACDLRFNQITGGPTFPIWVPGPHTSSRWPWASQCTHNLTAPSSSVGQGWESWSPSRRGQSPPRSLLETLRLGSPRTPEQDQKPPPRFSKQHGHTSSARGALEREFSKRKEEACKCKVKRDNVSGQRRRQEDSRVSFTHLQVTNPGSSRLACGIWLDFTLTSLKNLETLVSPFWWLRKWGEWQNPNHYLPGWAMKLIIAVPLDLWVPSCQGNPPRSKYLGNPVPEVTHYHKYVHRIHTVLDIVQHDHKVSHLTQRNTAYHT